jgi:hypothetical protein
VLEEIDAALAALLTAGLPSGVAVRFDRPDASWGGSGPVVGVLLHGVREDLAARTSGWSVERDADGAVAGRRASARRYLVHYLVTAWAEPVAREHELLGAALRALARTEVVPAGHLPGSLSATGAPVGLAVAHPDALGADVELWRAFGLPPRPVLDLRVTAVLVPDLETELPAPPERVDLALAGRLPQAPVAAQRPRPGRRITEPPGVPGNGGSGAARGEAG